MANGHARQIVSRLSSLVVKVIDLMEMVATGNAPQAKASKDEVFSVELQSQVGKNFSLQIFIIN